MQTLVGVERPFVDIHSAGPDGLFSDEDVDRLMALVQEVNESVLV